MPLTGLDLAVYGFNQNTREIEEAGISYELRIIRDKLTLGVNTEPILKQSPSIERFTGNWTNLGGAEGNGNYVSTMNEFMDPDDEQYLSFLRNLDSKYCKDQDHYKVLGLSNLRWQASTSQIRTAYRAKVLKHHPDKNNAVRIEATNGEDYFTCITKAYEQLGLSEQKRRAYDSVDPLFDDSIPDEKIISSDNFYDILAPVFIRNARWSVRQPVPLLGDINSAQAEVDRFYSFWFNWDSWREFSYLDEEDKEKGEDRWERREIEKINKVEREKRRKNEMKRIRNLVEMAYRKDPRVAMFKEQEKLKKEKQRDERRKALEEKKAQDEKKKMEIELKNKKIEEEKLEKQRQQLAYEKRIKEQQKKLLGEARRKLRRTAEGKNYWDADVSSKLSCLEAIEHVCLRLDAIRLNEITARLELLSSLKEAMDTLKVQIHKEVPESIETKDGVSPEYTTDTMSNWSPDEITLLVKATTLYPIGTIKRWSEIANYINEHRENKNAKKKTEKDVLIQAKTLKSLSNSQKHKKVKDILVNSAKGSELEWNAEEQKLLEAALKKFPSSDPARWENVANFVGKSKKECIRRFKYLAEVVKSKKEQLS
ncbi:DnaJ domain-containing protein [Wuchereria bancrofti]|uniref:DnaJ domain-containing protein n=1 Tax=Wuchereria bancrofti TaxID=6293 RepID=J9EVQ5_WUCBA|nr:DnaJ domain-containing protein [Wuchereria bancrofti]